MVRLGKVLFRYRNGLGPVLFVVALLLSRPRAPFGDMDWKNALEIAGALVAFAGQALRALTIGYDYIVRGGRNRQVYADRLVVGGIFAHCRNPMYTGNILIAVGIALVVNAYAFYLIVVPAILLVYHAIVAAEEAYLREKFGGEYDDYARRVNRWWPRFAGFRATVSGHRFNWSRVVVKEYGTFLLLAGALLVIHLWGIYSIEGAAALPSNAVIGGGALVWAALYLGIRQLKVSGYVTGDPPEPPT